MKFILYSIFAFISLNANSQSCWTAGNGSDGSFHATVDTTLASGEYNYTSFTIDTGVIVSVTGLIPLEIYCNGPALINGTLTVNGANGNDGVTFASGGLGSLGVAGGGNGGDGTFSASLSGVLASPGTNTGGGGAGDGWTGGGGAGYSSVGSDTGGAAGFGGIVYGTAGLATLDGGSGGGGGSGGSNCGAGGGGAGGGVILLFANTLTISLTGIISSNGGAGGSDGTGNCGGGGGGSGGTLYIGSPAMTINGLVSAVGGVGGASNIPGSPYFGVGGTGSDGRIRLDYGVLSGISMVTPPAFVDTIAPIASSQMVTICSSDSLIVGNNVYVTSGMYVDTLQSSQGCDSIVSSDLTVQPINDFSQTFDICMGDSVFVGMNIYTASGTYTDVLTGSNTCDSTVTTTVSVTSIDNSITASGATITATEASATYQWIDCDNGNAPIMGETNQSFTPTITGNYAVEITDNNCVVTSTCMLIDFTGLDELGLGTKTLVRITDLLGRETTFRPNTPLIYIYSDGSIQRVIHIQE